MLTNIGYIDINSKEIPNDKVFINGYNNEKLMFEMAALADGASLLMLCNLNTGLIKCKIVNSMVQGQTAKFDPIDDKKALLKKSLDTDVDKLYYPPEKHQRGDVVFD